MAINLKDLRDAAGVSTVRTGLMIPEVHAHLEVKNSPGATPKERRSGGDTLDLNTLRAQVSADKSTQSLGQGDRNKGKKVEKPSDPDKKSLRKGYALSNDQNVP